MKSTDKSKPKCCFLCLQKLTKNPASDHPASDHHGLGHQRPHQPCHQVHIFIYFPISLFTAHLDLEFLLYYLYSIRIPDHTVWRTLGRESNPGRVVKAHGKPLDHHTFLCLDCLRSNVVYVEGASLPHADLATCQASCQASPTCTFYTWNTVTQVGLSHLHLLHLEHSDTGRSVPPAPSTPEAQ